MEKYVGKVAVITGSSAGIGAAVSKELVKLGVIVVGLARRIEKLQNLSNELSNKKEYSGTFHILKCDISVEEEVCKSFQFIEKNIGHVSILVNNAGVGILRSTLDYFVEDFNKVFDTNVKGLLVCAKEAIKSMISNRIEGHVININSVLGKYTLPYRYNDFMVYKSSKQAASVLNEALRREIVQHKANIKISNIYPGLTDTEMTSEYMKTIKDRNQYLDAKDVANACISVLSTSSHVLISELTLLPIHEEI